MSSTETDALLVRSVDYRETDRIVTLITSDLGKVGAIAYGARRSTRRFPGALQPFQRIRVVLKSRRSNDLYELVEADVIESFTSIPGDPRRYACAAYLLELAREMTPEHEPDPAMLAVLVRFLRRLDGHGACSRTLASALLAVLTQAGFAPALDRCAACGRAAPLGKAGHFEVSRGIVCTSCGGTGPVLSGQVRHALLAAARDQEQTACSEKELSRAIRLICAFAREQTGKELRSWGLLDRTLRAMEV